MGPATKRPPAARVARLVALLLLGVAVAVGAALAAGTSQAWADPTPAPAPAAGVPDPGVRPSPNPPPTAPNTTPSPIGPPPTTTPSPATPKTPAPTNGPTPPGGIPTDSGDDPGLFDIPGQIRKAINDFLLWVAKTGLKPVLDTLGQTVLSTPDLTANAQVKTFWTTSLVAANGIFVLFVIAGGFIVASRETLQTSYGLKEIAPRVVVAAVAANASLLVCRKAIEAVNALTAAITGQGVDGQGAADAIEEILNQPVAGGMPPILFALLILAALVMAIVVVMTFVLRIALLVMLLGVAPLALTGHATPMTEGLAYAWWRAFAACLGIQLGQAVIILATIRVFLTPTGPQVLGMPATTGGLLSILVCLTMLWLLIKLPGWMKHLILGPLGRRNGRGLVAQIIHAVVLLKTLGALAGAGGRTSHPTGSRASAASARRGPRPGTELSSSGGPFPGRPTPGTRGPRPRSRPGSVPARPGPSRSRPSRRSDPPPAPAPRPGPAAGPAAFSHAPAHHVPMQPPAGSATASVFTSAQQPATPRPAPVTPATAARFSHQRQPPPAPPATGSRPAPAQFSHAPAPDTPRRSPGPAPAVTFSAAPRPQTAPKRPPAPATPVFSSPAHPAPGSSRSGPAVSSRSPAASPSSPPVPPSRSGRTPRRAPSPPVPPPRRRSRQDSPRERGEH
jgi:hypothetical protein